MAIFYVNILLLLLYKQVQRMILPQKKKKKKKKEEGKCNSGDWTTLKPYLVKNVVDVTLFFHNTFIFSYASFQYDNLLFYFDI